MYLSLFSVKWTQNLYSCIYGRKSNCNNDKSLRRNKGQKLPKPGRRRKIPIHNFDVGRTVGIGYERFVAMQMRMRSINRDWCVRIDNRKSRINLRRFKIQQIFHVCKCLNLKNDVMILIVVLAYRQSNTEILISSPRFKS